MLGSGYRACGGQVCTLQLHNLSNARSQCSCGTKKYFHYIRPHSLKSFFLPFDAPQKYCTAVEALFFLYLSMTIRQTNNKIPGGAKTNMTNPRLVSCCGFSRTVRIKYTTKVHKNPHNGNNADHPSNDGGGRVRGVL